MYINKLVVILTALILVFLILFIICSKQKQLRFSRYNSIFRNDFHSELTHIENNTSFATQFNDLGSIWSDLNLYLALLPYLAHTSFWLWSRAHSFDRVLSSGYLWYGGVSNTGLYFSGEREELSNTLPVNTSSWAGAMYCCYIVMTLYRCFVSAISGAYVS